MRCKNGQAKLYKRNITRKIKGSSYKTEFQVNDKHCQPAFPLPPGTLVSLVQKQEAPTVGGNTAPGLSVPIYWALHVNSNCVIPWHPPWIIKIEEDNINHIGSGKQKILWTLVLLGEDRTGKIGTLQTAGYWEIQNNGSRRVP